MKTTQMTDDTLYLDDTLEMVWHCLVCRAEGVIEVAPADDTIIVRQRFLSLHRDTSPLCRGDENNIVLMLDGDIGYLQTVKAEEGDRQLSAVEAESTLISSLNGAASIGLSDS